MAFLNATALAAKAGVSESTVTRLAYSLDYGGYAGLQAAIQEMFKSEIHSLERFPLEQQENGDRLWHRVVAMERSIIDEMLEGMKEADFESAVELLFRADEVVVVGTEFNHVVAEYAAVYMNVIRKKVHRVTTLDAKAFNAMRDFSGENAVALVYSFPRYPRRTQEVLSLLSEQGVPVVGVSDTVFSPIAEYCTHLFVVPQKFITFIDPYAGAMALTHALLTALLMKDKEYARKRVREYDAFLESQGSYLLEEVDIVDLL
ncbi:MAG: MurR/RpiR family transcriptional regulator [Synergistales bacterium]|nr:MurR/RpiR family transcriptional regulator [Synergistales bacterium]